jgi:serine phosphatase RsbU (regulator of sigma subunit)
VRFATFDAYQAAAPRVRQSAPAVIVAIDGASLERHGQWPWPRTTLARLVTAVVTGRPAAMGIAIVMAEPDRLSPDRLARLLPGLEPDLASRLERLPGHDAVLAAALRHLPIALGVAGVDDTPQPAGAARHAPVRLRGGDALPFVRRHAGVLRSVPEIDAAAAGHGLVNSDVEAGRVRRLPLVAAVDRALVPTLGIEMLRLAAGAPSYTVDVTSRGVESISVAGLTVPTESDGAVWIHYAPHDPGRFVSAGDVLEGRAPPSLFERRLVLVGVTALGLGDYHATPVSTRMSGVEIHAQLLENLFEGRRLLRPRWAAWAEAAVLTVGGLLLVARGPAWSVPTAVALGLAMLAAASALGFLAYLRLGLLLDAAVPVLGLAATFATLMGTTLAQAQAQRRALRRQLAAEREAAARVAGELEAARRIQMGTLPRAADVVAGDDRVALHAVLEPARAVGGDFYDFFRLDGDRLCVLVGDVSGNGVPGSLFMAVSKALCKNAVLRHAGDLAAAMREASVALARDNAEALFASVWVGVLDAGTGRLEYCNAGHEPAWLLAADGAAPRSLADGGGLPLGLADGDEYVTAACGLRTGDTLCLLTDGVTETGGPGGDLYGRTRLASRLRALSGTGVDAVAGAIRADIAAFAAGTEIEDDIALLVLRWHGAAPPSSVSAR